VGDGKDKYRPGIVIEVRAGRLLVMTGTTKGSGREHIEQLPLIEPNSREGMALKLTQPTSFMISGYHIVAMEAVQRRDGRCPPLLFTQLQALAAKAEREISIRIRSTSIYFTDAMLAAVVGKRVTLTIQHPGNRSYVKGRVWRADQRYVFVGPVEEKEASETTALTRYLRDRVVHCREEP